MSISRRGFVRAAGLVGVSSLWSAPVILARGREAAVGEGREFQSPALPASGGPIRLSSNENPVGPPRVAVEALKAALGDAPRYPARLTQHVSERVAAHHGVGVDSVVMGCGSTEILRMAVQAWTAPRRALVTAAPTFEDPGRYAELLGVPVIAVPLTRELKLDLGDMAARATGAGLVFVCNPNNPTGTVHGATAISEFVDRVHRVSPETTVLIDEAYHHYVEDPAYATALPLALERRNVVVCRTFSKLYGMAGLRLGYALAQPQTIAALRRYRLANGVNALVAPAAAAALDDASLQGQERARNHAAREFTRTALAGIGYPSVASEANFIMVDVRRDAREFQKACNDRGVQIGRPFPPLMTHARISIGTMEEMTAAVGVLKKILAES
ncbi:MAG TPA: aminotransferase class I/II-fold pyridoxal phosphate-dependent enzyme [Vicinamibacterales bacterium]|nr:aminotransferase class I/II-fold pyridoxal phosphate-dependent enzyme [Vicinamibacterales bacterium]